MTTFLGAGAKETTGDIVHLAYRSAETLEQVSGCTHCVGSQPQVNVRPVWCCTDGCQDLYPLRIREGQVLIEEKSRSTKAHGRASSAVPLPNLRNVLLQTGENSCVAFFTQLPRCNKQ